MVEQGGQLYGTEVSAVNTGGCLVQSATILITPSKTSPYKSALLLMVCYHQFSSGYYDAILHLTQGAECGMQLQI
jgi:hypothetical protein